VVGVTAGLLKTMFCFTNGKLLRGGKLVDDNLWIDRDSGKVVDPLHLFYSQKSGKEKQEYNVVVDCAGKIVSPGFIDVQVNGKRFYSLLLA
jgi:N-acetylglucosamine-6-phosphate deacetylase